MDRKNNEQWSYEKYEQKARNHRDERKQPKKAIIPRTHNRGDKYVMLQLILQGREDGEEYIGCATWEIGSDVQWANF